MGIFTQQLLQISDSRFAVAFDSSAACCCCFTDSRPKVAHCLTPDWMCFMARRLDAPSIKCISTFRVPFGHYFSRILIKMFFKLSKFSVIYDFILSAVVRSQRHLPTPNNGLNFRSHELSVILIYSDINLFSPF